MTETLKTGTNPPSGRNPLLKLVRDDIIISPCPRKVIVRSEFEGVRFKISDISKEFEEDFFDITEEPTTTTSRLEVDMLIDDSKSQQIITGFEGADRARISIIEFCILLGNQPDKEDGPLLVDGRINLFFLVNNRKVIKTVTAGWNDGIGWSFLSKPINYERKWFRGSYVVSRVPAAAHARRHLITL